MEEQLLTLESQIGGWIDFVGTLIDIFGVAVILVGILLASVRYFSQMRAQRAYTRYKIEIGLALLLGLEILVAADIVKTVAIEPHLENVAVLGLLVIIRTFLSWTLVLEIEGRWPWQKPNAEEAA